MKKVIIAAIILALICFYFSYFEKSTVVIDYTEIINGKIVNKTEEIKTDIDPTVDETTVKVGHIDGEEVIVIDTRYHKMIHPCSWKYIHTDGENKQIKRAYIEYNDSTYNLTTKN